MTLEELSAESSPCPITGCWWWTGSVTRRGYGQLRQPGLTGRYAHREMYRAVHGQLPARAVVRHTCDQPSCVNPMHLLVGTQANNIADMIARGRHSNMLKTSCSNGHPFSADNTRLDEKGSRRCRECGRRANRESQAKKRRALGVPEMPKKSHRPHIA